MKILMISALMVLTATSAHAEKSCAQTMQDVKTKIDIHNVKNYQLVIIPASAFNAASKNKVMAKCENGTKLIVLK